MLDGVYPPIATPFDDDGQLDLDALRANIQKWDTTGLSGYVVAGSNGESALLEDDEIVAAVEIVRQAAVAERTIIAGVGRQSTSATIALAKATADAGSEVALVMTPSFYSGQMTREALAAHYWAIADASPVPVLIYNVPKFTHLNIPAATVAHIAQHENVVGIKDSAGDIAQIIELVRLCPEGFDILIGNGPAFLSGLQAGASGGILAVANVAPRECVRIQELVRAGKHGEARAIHMRTIPIGRAVTSQFGVPGLKAALDELGYLGGAPRPPLLPATDEARQAIRGMLIEAGLV